MNLLTDYHLAGMASAFFSTLSLTGLVLQVRFIRRRVRWFVAGELADERPTTTISINRFAASYFGFYSMLVYGLFLQPMNHYLVWPRVLAVLLILQIFHAILTDRKGRTPLIVFIAGVILFLAAIFIRALNLSALLYAIPFAQSLVVAATLIFLQGTIHQVIKIIKSGRTGGLSLSMHQLFFVKDFSLFVFGITMGFEEGWPLMLFNGVSVVMQSVSMWLFHWAKTSPNARQRRLTFQPD